MYHCVGMQSLCPNMSTFSGASHFVGLQRNCLLDRRLVARRSSQVSTKGGQQHETARQLQQAERDLGPYLLWDKAMKLQAVFDSRACSQVDLTAVTQLLEQHALHTPTVDHSIGSSGQQLTAMTVICSHRDGDQVAAALLQLTPATHITATSCEQCYLPQHTLAVSTPYGSVDVHLSLAGSKVSKITPDWRQCEEVAAKAQANDRTGPAAAGPADASGISGGVIDATTVAAAVVQELRTGLDDGSIDLQMQYLF